MVNELKHRIAAVRLENNQLLTEIQWLEDRKAGCTSENEMIARSVRTYFAAFWQSSDALANSSYVDLVSTTSASAWREVSHCLIPASMKRADGSCAVWTPVLAALVALVVTCYLLWYCAVTLALSGRLQKAAREVEGLVRQQNPQWDLMPVSYTHLTLPTTPYL